MKCLKLYQDSERYISYELGALSDYHYYTGIIFSGYTFGTGEPIVKGGRYDKLLKYFGKDAPAIGFAIASDQLLAAIQRQKTEITTDKEYQLLLYPRKLQKEAILKAQELRKTGALIELLCMDETKSKENYQAYAEQNRDHADYIYGRRIEMEDMRYLTFALGKGRLSKPDLRNF